MYMNLTLSTVEMKVLCLLRKMNFMCYSIYFNPDNNLVGYEDKSQKYFKKLPRAKESSD